MNARFAAKKTPTDMLEALSESMVQVTVCKAKSRSKNSKVKATFSGSVLTINDQKDARGC
jgi:hypothetical protein